jgi:hypothetical protein
MLQCDSDFVRGIAEQKKTDRSKRSAIRSVRT